ncbi:hypothetical protein [Streptomyces sp. F-1]|uniref:hypothetical protein n=1 Tax=Streptomyces sp. F-1 TaxID=463642 RepID=UPI00085CAFF5|nr:hypothetical protein [Streptomyces sp. F-1]SFY51299.1 hypothetical protein STEPF1_04556 [Streptomyces sp. F-1]
MNRLTAYASAVLTACASVLCLAPSAQADTQRVTAADLGPGRPWLRIQDQGSSAHPPGVQEVSPFADPVHWNGSLHLAIGPGQQSQAAHFYTGAVQLSTVMGSEISYDSYVDGAHSTATGTGPNLQLPMFCDGAFTTLSFQPQLATDAEGRHGVVPDIWQHWVSGPSGIWRTSRAVAGFPAGGDAPLSDFAEACTGATSGVIGLIGNVGSLGDPTASLDTYMDNLTANGTTYDFAVDGTATARVDLRAASTGEEPARIDGTAVFHSPADGPEFVAPGARLTIGATTGLDPRNVQVTIDGVPAQVTSENGHLVAQLPRSLADRLLPGGTLTVPFTITSTGDGGNGCGYGGYGKGDDCGGNGGGEHGTATVTARLLARGYQPLQATDVSAEASIAF